MKIIRSNPILVTVLTLLVLGFFWFAVRPSLIRKICLEEVKKVASESKGISNSSANSRYRACLAEHGLRPESLFVQD